MGKESTLGTCLHIVGPFSLTLGILIGTIMSIRKSNVIIVKKVHLRIMCLAWYLIYCVIDKLKDVSVGLSQKNQMKSQGRNKGNDKGKDFT